MPATIGADAVRHVARLARLDLTTDEERWVAEQLGRILAHFEQLQELDTNGVEPLAHPLPVTDVVRTDQPHRSLDAEAALRNAPQRHEGFFKVPRILEQGSGA